MKGWVKSLIEEIKVIRCLCGIPISNASTKTENPEVDIERIICKNCLRIVGTRKIPWKKKVSS